MAYQPGNFVALFYFALSFSFSSAVISASGKTGGSMDCNSGLAEDGAVLVPKPNYPPITLCSWHSKKAEKFGDVKEITIKAGPGCGCGKGAK